MMPDFSTRQHPDYADARAACLLAALAEATAFPRRDIADCCRHEHPGCAQRALRGLAPAAGCRICRCGSLGAGRPSRRLPQNAADAVCRRARRSAGFLRARRRTIVRSSDRGFSPSADGYPSEGVSFIESNYSGARLFNDYGWGGYVIDRLYPNTPVFIDGRADVYGSKIFDDYIHVLRVDDGWDDLLSRYGVEVALVQRDSKLAKAMSTSSDWQEEFTGPVESVFVRR